MRNSESKKLPFGSLFGLFEVYFAFVFLLEDFEQFFQQVFVLDAGVFLCIVVDRVDFEDHDLVGLLVVFDENYILLALVFNNVEKFKLNLVALFILKCDESALGIHLFHQFFVCHSRLLSERSLFLTVN